MTERHPNRRDCVLTRNGVPLTAEEEDKFWRQLDLFMFLWALLILVFGAFLVGVIGYLIWTEIQS